MPSESAGKAGVSGLPELLSILDGTSSAIWSTDADLCLTFANAAAVELWRRAYGVEAGPGDTVPLGDDDAERGRWRSIYERALDGEELDLLFERAGAPQHMQLDLTVSPAAGPRGERRVVVVGHEAGTRRRALLETNAAATAILAPDMTLLFVNAEVERLLGVPREEIEGSRTVADFIHPDDLEIVRRNHFARRENPAAAPRSYEFRVLHSNGSVRHVFAVVGMLESTGYSVASLLDITEEKENREHLARYADHLRALHESAAELTASLNDPERIYRSALSLLSRTVAFDSGTIQVLEGGRLQVVACEGFSEPEQVLSLQFDRDERYPNWQVVERKAPYRVDDVTEWYPHFTEESDQFASGHILSWIGVPLLAQDELIGVMALDRAEVRPFSDEEEQLVVSMAHHVAGAVRNARLYETQLAYERELLAANNQKETLLKELHHRVKNNLQLVSSLIRLRSDTLADADARQAFDELSLRVNSLASIHEELYQATSLDRIDLGEYARSVVDQVVGLYPVNLAVDVNTTAEGVVAPVEVSVPFGLILSELVLNSVKHAFPGSRSGRLSVAVTSHGEEAQLVVADDGVGIPAERDLEQEGGLGLDLVNSLCEQLDAELELRRGEGTTWVVTFPLSVS